jgi:hypothetical protein
MIEQQILQQLKMLPAVKQIEVLDFTQFLVKKTQTNLTKKPKRLGLLKGKLSVSDDFDEPLPDDMVQSFYISAL